MWYRILFVKNLDFKRRRDVLLPPKEKRKKFSHHLGWIRTHSLQNNTTLDLPACAPARCPRPPSHDPTPTGQRSARPKPHSILMTSSLEGGYFRYKTLYRRPLLENFLETKLTVLFLSFYISVSLYVYFVCLYSCLAFFSGYFCKNCNIMGEP